MLSVVEEVVTKELGGLCKSCVYAEDCVYKRKTQKVVIQCEVFETVGDATYGRSNGDAELQGLCLNCSKNHYCSLPKEASGVWHCEEYE